MAGPSEVALVVGFGSIGARHARLLSDIGYQVAVVSRRSNIDWPNRFSDVGAALSQHSIRVAVVANETSEHWGTLRLLRGAGYCGPILVEKPLAMAMPDPAEVEAHEGRVWVGYNLRFHPALQKLKRRLEDHDVIDVCCRVGQDLRTWREGRILSQSYSSSRAKGGGVLRDLSHELDILSWLFGGIRSVVASGGKLGPLPIDSDDSWQILATSGRCSSLSVHLDYYAQPPLRDISVNTVNGTIRVDLLRHSYFDWKGESSWPVDRDTTYRAQLRALAGQSREMGLCTFREGLETVAVIEAIERSATERAWVSLP